MFTFFSGVLARSVRVGLSVRIFRRETVLSDNSGEGSPAEDYCW